MEKREQLIESGMIVTVCTEADKAVILEKINPLIDMLYSQYSWAEELVNKVNNVQ